MRRCWPILLWLLGLGCCLPAAAADTPQITVQVQGLSGPLLKNVLAYLSVVTYRDAPDLTESLVEHLHARAPDEIQRALQPYGYYDTQVDGTLTPTAEGWTVRYNVTLPPPVRIRHIDVVLSGEGRGDGSYDQFVRELPYHVGDQLDQKAYES
ncbi:MAG TPA: POTRA domain-containing protein, partial [Gammaproteobacteria bacterium]